MIEYTGGTNKMKVYKSKIMGLISKNAVKARKFKRGTIERYGSAGAFF